MCGSDRRGDEGSLVADPSARERGEQLEGAVLLVLVDRGVDEDELVGPDLRGKRVDPGDDLGAGADEPGGEHAEHLAPGGVYAELDELLVGKILAAAQDR